MIRVRAGGCAFAVAEELADLARPRCDLTAWRAPQPPAFQVTRALALPGGAPLDRTEPSLGAFAVGEAGITATVSGDPRAAEAALKVGFALAAHGQGGLLLHSSAFEWPEIGGVVAFGPSGAGKSTLARFALAAGATLLSDETNQLLPDARLAGTPFRSDTSLTPSPVTCRVRALLTLTHGAQEGLRPLALHQVFPRLLAQVYGLPQHVLDTSALMARAQGLLAGVGAFDFTFRNHPDAAHWLRDELRAR